MTVQIGGDTSELSKALNKPNQEINSLKSKLSSINEALKLDPSNVDLLSQKQRILGKEVDSVKEKLKTLKLAQDQFISSGKDIDSDGYIEIEKQIAEAENSLKKLNKQQTNVSAGFESMAIKAGQFGEKSTQIGKSLLPLTAGIVAAGVGAFKFGSDTNEAMNKVDVAFGNSSKEVKGFADNALQTYGIAKGTALDMAALFGDMATSMTFPQSEAANMATSLTGLAGDISSFKNMNIEEVTTALNGVFTGESESLKRLGIVMTETNLAQYALSQGITKSYSEMEQDEKVRLRYNYVIDSSKNSMGDFARTSDQAANQTRTMQEGIKELAASFGEVLLPIITPLIAQLNDFIAWLMKLDPNIKNVIVIIGILVAAIGPVLILIGKIATGVKALKSAFTILSANPIILIVVAIVALVAAFAYLWNTSEEFRQFWYDLWDGIAVFFSECWNNIMMFFTVTIPQALEDFKINLGFLGESIKQVFSDAWNGVITFFTETIPSWIVSVGEWFNKIPYNIGLVVGHIIGFFIKLGIDLQTFVTQDIPKFVNSVGAWFASLPNIIWQWLCGTFEKIKQWGLDIIDEGNKRAKEFIDAVVKFFSELPGKIGLWLNDTANKVLAWGIELCAKGRQAARDLVDTIVNVVKSLPGQMVNIGKNLVQGIWNGIISAKDWILGKINEFTDGVVDGIKDFFGIASPSRIMRDQVGKYISEGIGVGIKQNEKSALSPLGELVKKASNLASTIQVGGSFDYSGVQNKLNNALSLNSEFMNSAVIQLNASFETNLDGREIARSNTSYTTSAQLANLAFKGA